LALARSVKFDEFEAEIENQFKQTKILSLLEEKEDSLKKNRFRLFFDRKKKKS